MDTTPQESEIKIPVERLDDTRERLRVLDAALLHPSAREVNVLLDDGFGSLRNAGQVLRIRRYGERVRLTLKGAARFVGGVKIRDELEVGASDAELLERIFRGLGFEPWMRYEKDREAWSFNEVEVVLDHTPMGGFVELEGAVELLAETARRLGLEPNDAVRGSYVSLWTEERRRHPDLPHDMVFR